MDIETQARITRELLAYGGKVATADLFPTLVPEAAPLIRNDRYAFLMAVCLDRGTKAEIIWTIPYYVREQLGHLDPRIIYKMRLDELANTVNHLPKRPHYLKAAARTIQDLTRIVVDECDGDASKIWEGKQAWQVKQKLESIYGVGEGIANMGVLLIEKAFSVKFSDKGFMDIKSDTHTMRVLYRLGVSDGTDVESAMQAARRMNPSFPGELDNALWSIGREWCRASEPLCAECTMNDVCLKRI